MKSKVILYMATTPNGYIAKADDDTSWISEAEWNSYAGAVKNAGCMIVGHRTYEILTGQPEFADLAEIKLVAVSSKSFATKSANHLVASSPKAALECLKDFEQVIVAGGGQLNTAFLESNLVDEIILDIEPTLFGRGIPVFAEGNFDLSLELLGQKSISKNEIQLHYKVLRRP